MKANMKLGLCLFVICFTLKFGSIEAVGGCVHKPKDNERRPYNVPRKCKCGIRNPSRQEMISACGHVFSEDRTHKRMPVEMVMHGDIVAPPYKYPWIVAIFKKGYRACTGSLISRYYVITAAHCAHNSELIGHISHNICYDKRKRHKNCWFLPEDVTVSFLTDGKVLTEQMSVSQITIHPGYRVQSIVHDLALLRLSNPSPCDEYRRPICISRNVYNEESHAEATVMGFGRNSNVQDEKTRDLREGKLMALNKTACDAVKNSGMDNMMCFVGIRKQGACFGDSGGPLALEEKGVYFLIGVLSAVTNALCSVAEPSFYPSIQKHVQWIEKHVKELPRASFVKPIPHIMCDEVKRMLKNEDPKP